MSTYRQLTYLVLDELKGQSDDFTYTEDHIIFLLDKYRAFLLKQRYSDIKKQMPESNYQTLCLDLIQVPAISGDPCEGGTYLRSKDKIPNLMQLGSPRVTSTDYYQGDFNYVSRDRMRYVGNNRFLKNMIYTSISPDQHLYFKSQNSEFLNLEKVQMTGIFQDASEAAQLSCGTDVPCDVLDSTFPLEEALISPLIELITKELLGASYRPEDSNNNANDDLSNLVSFIRRNTKSALQKQIED